MNRSPGSGTEGTEGTGGDGGDTGTAENVMSLFLHHPPAPVSSSMAARPLQAALLSGPSLCFNVSEEKLRRTDMKGEKTQHDMRETAAGKIFPGNLELPRQNKYLIYRRMIQS